MTNGSRGATDEYDIVGQPVLFSSGNMAEASTRAGDPPKGSVTPYYHDMNSTDGVPYMAEGGRFVCTMYYHAADGADDSSPFDIIHKSEGGTATTAWLKVNNNVGNSVYRQASFPNENTITLSDEVLQFDKNATCFYWQNRLPHAFLALADYNKLETNTGSGTGTLKLHQKTGNDLDTDLMAPATEEDETDPTGVANNRYANIYDLRRDNYVLDANNKEVKNSTKAVITDQPDPIMALTIMTPAGATQEANRVKLYFKHQFSQIQVNLRGADDGSANIDASQIEGVELLGVAEEAYVFNRLNTDGTIGAAMAKAIHLDDYNDAQLQVNQWGTSFSMFDMALGDADGDNVPDGTDAYAIGFLKSYNAIAFGRLEAIRITWHEGTDMGTNRGVVHVSTFVVPQENERKEPLRELVSGKRYVYNLELRRGTLAVIRAEVLDWLQDENYVYGDSGTIKK